MTGNEFFDTIASNGMNVGGGDDIHYLAQHTLFQQIPQLERDFIAPDYCFLDGEGLRSVNAWLGPGGTVSPMHHDPHRNLLAQVVGWKRIRLFAPADTDRLYPHGTTLLGNTRFGSRTNLQCPSRWLHLHSRPRPRPRPHTRTGS